jgi:hypothetical protein
MKMNMYDFSCSELQEAWIGYHKAIQYIQSKPNRDSQGFKDLIASHQDKIQCIERAQRILNTYKAIQNA